MSAKCETLWCLQLKKLCRAKAHLLVSEVSEFRENVSEAMKCCMQGCLRLQPWQLDSAGVLTLISQSEQQAHIEPC